MALVLYRGVVLVPDPFIIIKKLSGSGDLPVHYVFLRHLWNATIKATFTHMVNQNYIFMKSYVLLVNI